MNSALRLPRARAGDRPRRRRSSSCSSPTSSGRVPRRGSGVAAIAGDRRARRADPGASRSRPTATTRSMFGGAFVVDNYALAFQGFFLVVGLRLAAAVGRLHRRRRLLPGRVLLPAAHLGARHDGHGRRRATSITIFVALETISIPTFVLAGWRKHDPKSNEAAIKYFLIGVLSTGDDALRHVVRLRPDRLDAALATSPTGRLGERRPRCSPSPIFLTLVGFAFKVSAVPFHFWAPDTYEGAPTPVTAFLSVASKAGGFVALLTSSASASSRRPTRGSRCCGSWPRRR